MPTRTINLKLVLGQKDDTVRLRRALWTTHREINQAVAEIERFLLRCRGASYRTVDASGEVVVIPESQVVSEALAMARKAQERNGIGHFGTDEEILDALRQLYEQIVPSSRLDEQGNPQKGDAQAANAWVSPLMDPESEAGLSVFELLLDTMPAWVDLMQQGDPGWEEASVAWLKTPEGERLQRVRGRPPAWLNRLRSGQPWQQAFIEDQDRKRKEAAAGNAYLMKRLKDLGLLPLIAPRMRQKIAPDGRGVSTWDRLAMRLAVAHLLSWESWNHRTKKEHEFAKTTLETMQSEYQGLEHAFQALRAFEAERHQELKLVAEAKDDQPYRIGVRAIRSWDRVRERWLEKGADQERRIQILRELQTKLRGEFGDPALMRWLAKDGHEFLWQDQDCVTPFVRLNVAQRELEKRKEFALMTFANARLHPRWAMYEAPGGTNLYNYKLSHTDQGLVVELKLLEESKDGTLVNEDFSVKLAPSGQLKDLRIETLEGNKQIFHYTSSHQSFSGIPGGAELLFDRTYLENPDRTEWELMDRPGPVWFKLTLDVQSMAPDAWLGPRGQVLTPPEVSHFNTALSNKSRHADKIAPGLRVLSVDLGLRTFASCAVFELVQGKPQTGFYLPAADGRSEDDPEKLWAKHERSFKLMLPGENPSDQELDARRAAFDELRSINRDIDRLKRILRLGAIENEEERDARLEELRESIAAEQTKTAFTEELLKGFGDAAFRTTPSLWQQHCQEYYDRAEQAVAQRVSEWRKRTRPKAGSWDDWRARRGYHGGKSIWMIDYLENVRKLLLRWNLRGRKYGQINRQDKKRYGTVAANLLKHINSLKEDRVKTGADLIIQAARGYVPAPAGIGWEKQFEPCRVILFEDLARYRFRADRPRRENSQLMKWNHREIVNETSMQAELYGMVVTNTAAGYSSRYHAKTGRPGVRARVLVEQDFDQGLPKPYVVRELAWMLGPNADREFEAQQRALCEKIAPGMLVPWNDGELFVTLQRKQKTNGEQKTVPLVLHADINAAQNLQRRFWSRNGEAIRLYCKRAPQYGQDAWELVNLPGARLLGALQQMEHGDRSFYLAPASDQARAMYAMRPISNARKLKAIRDEDFENEVEEDIVAALAELEDVSTRNLETFFRDPSGFFFPAEYWIPAAVFWGRVKQEIWRVLKKDDVPF